MNCPECARLRQEYERLGLALAAAIDALVAGTRTNSPDLYESLRKTAEEARLDADGVMIEAALHRRSHTERVATARG